jgi:hypothetical protein
MKSCKNCQWSERIEYKDSFYGDTTVRWWCHYYPQTVETIRESLADGTYVCSKWTILFDLTSYAFKKEAPKEEKT